MALQSTGIILRQETNPDLTTKNAELTFEELDTNFILIYEDLKALSGSGALPPWVVSTTYSQNVVISYDGLIWKYVNPTPSAGVVPGSDPLFWVQLAPTELTHVQNTDTKLGKGTVDEVSANEIRTFLDTPIVLDNLYNNDGSLYSNRQVNLNGKTLIFFGTDTGTEFISTTAAFGLKGYSNNNGVIGQGDTGVFGQGVTFGVKSDGVYGIYSTGQFPGLFVPTVAGGIGIEARQGSGSFSGKFTGNGVLIENDSTSSLNASSILELASTNKGSLPFPRMNTTQKNAIASPATGLHVFDTTNNRPEYFNGSYFQGDQRLISVFSGSNSYASGVSRFFFNLINAPSTTEATNVIKSPISGIIRKAFIRSFASGIAGDRTLSVYIRVDSVDYLVQTITSTGAHREFINTALNIPIVENVSNIVCYAVASGGTADSTNVFFGGSIVVE